MCEPLRLHSLQLPKSEGGAVTPDRSVAAPSAEGPQGKAQGRSQAEAKVSRGGCREEEDSWINQTNVKHRSRSLRYLDQILQYLC